MKKSSDIILSIGMIVKNEEKSLPRCLDSLKPIMDEMPCQLIITDTGSTDKTVEIAKKYTDEVFSFQWCDDFAAARNFGLEKAKGKWFMFIDADEWFEDCSEIIEFFKSGEYEKYANATYIVRNYVNSQDKNNFEDYNLGRLFRMREGIKFKGIIHEHIDMCLPIKEFSAYVNHYGYSIDNSKVFSMNKHQRNLQLLIKEYDNNPDDIRLAYLLAKQYAAGDMKADFRKMILDTYSNIKENYENNYLPYFTYQTALIYRDEENLEYAIKVIKDYQKGQAKKEAWSLDMLVALTDLSNRNKDYKGAIKYAKEYFKQYELYKKGKLPTGIAGIVTKITFSKDVGTITVSNLMAQAYIRLEEKEKALEIIKCLDFNKIIVDDLKDSLKLFFYIAFSEALWQEIVEIYINILKTANHEKIAIYEENLEENILEFLPAYEAVAKEFYLNDNIQEEFLEENYVQLQKLRVSMLTGDNFSSQIIAKEFLKKNYDIAISPIYSEFMLFAITMDEGVNAINKIDIDEVNLYTNKLNSMYDNLDEILVNLFNGINVGITLNKKVEFWTICLMEIVLIKNSFKLERDNEKFIDLFNLYIKKANYYMSNIYSYEILNDKDIDLLPKTYRFIYYGGKAQKSYISGEYINYVRLLKEAIKHYPIMAKSVEIIIDKVIIEEETRKSNIENIEFEMYAKTIKSKIKEIANLGQKDEAIELLQSYEKINPKDVKGIIEIKKALGILN